MTTLPEDADRLIRRLKEIREKDGEEAYQAAYRDLAKQVLNIPQGEEILKRFFPDLDPAEAKKGEPTKAKPPETPPMPKVPSFGDGTANEMMLQMLKAQIPNLKTQAQFNVFMGCFDALRTTLNAYFGGQAAAGETARDALNKVLDMAKQLHELAAKIDEIPEEVQSETAKEFSQPASQLHEYDEARTLATELEQISTSERLQQWYEASRARLDRVTNVRLRNELFDTIRQKRNELGSH